MTIAFWILIFIGSLIVLVKASDYFTASAEKIGLMAGIPQFIVGATIVSMGTSLPELISSIIAVANDSSEIVAGNVIGSNIANILLILGIGAIAAKTLNFRQHILPIDLPIFMTSAFLLAFACWDGVFSFGEAVIFLLGLVFFLLYSINARPKKKNPNGTDAPAPAPPKISVEAKPFIILVISGVFVYVGARYTIESIIELSAMLNLGKEVIAVSAVALGTSLPELAVTLSAVKSGNPEMVIGNVLGSNIFNAYAVMGIPGLFSDLIIPKDLIDFGVPALIAVSILFLVSAVDRRVSKWEGWLFLLFYAFFIGKMFHAF